MDRLDLFLRAPSHFSIMRSTGDDEPSNGSHLPGAVKSLSDRCQVILKDCETRPIQGLYRYTQSLTAEAHFLQGLLEAPETIKEKHIQSSNLSYLEAVHDVLTSVDHVDEMMRLVPVPSATTEWMPKKDMMRTESIKLDLVAEQELVWIRVIARNAKGLRHDMAGLELEDEDDDEESSDSEGEFYSSTAHGDAFADLPIFKKAAKYLRSAEAHHVHYRKPIVVFAFMRIRPNEDVFVQRLMDRLTEMGIVVHLQEPGGPTVRETYAPYLPQQRQSLTTATLNVDVSTALAITSEMTHHPCRPDQVDGEALQLQANREAEAPVLPVLKDMLTDKRLVMVRSAFERLESIVSVVGGDREKRRFRYLFQEELGESIPFDHVLWTNFPSMTIQVIPDRVSERYRRLLEPPKRRNKLNNGRKIRTRFSEFHAMIFGSGDAYQMTTVTAIQWMATALADAGITGVSILVHEPRSLSEQKMHVIQ